MINEIFKREDSPLKNKEDLNSIKNTDQFFNYPHWG